jgi:hypothetical protein
MRHFVRAAPQHSLGSLARLLWLDLHRLLGDYEMGRLVVKHAFAAIGALSVSVFLAALAAGVGLLHASLLGVFALAFMVWGAGFVYLLFSGAKEVNDCVDQVSDGPSRVDAATVRRAHLRAVPPLSQDDAGLAVRPFTEPAAKGFKRDRCIGQDALSRADREWTQPVKPWGMN